MFLGTGFSSSYWRWYVPSSVCNLEVRFACAIHDVPPTLLLRSKMTKSVFLYFRSQRPCRSPMWPAPMTANGWSCTSFCRAKLPIPVIVIFRRISSWSCCRLQEQPCRVAKWRASGSMPSRPASISLISRTFVLTTQGMVIASSLPWILSSVDTGVWLAGMMPGPRIL